MKTKTSPELKQLARQTLSGHFGVLIIALLTMQCILNVPSLFVDSSTVASQTVGRMISIAVSLIVAFLSAIFLVGQNYMYLSLLRKKELRITDMWYGFKGHADDTIICYFIILLKCLISAVPFILALAAYYVTKNLMAAPLIAAGLILFLVISTLIMLNYSFVFYLIADEQTDASLKPMELLAMSKQMMQGNKGRLFYLYVSFIGMYALSLLSFGIGLLWVHPYCRMTIAGFYESLVGDAETDTDSDADTAGATDTNSETDAAADSDANTETAAAIDAETV